MRKYLNPSCSTLSFKKDFISSKEKELIQFVSSKINAKEKRICVAHPDGSGKSNLLNLLSAYYKDGAFDYLFDYRDEHFGKYDVIRISLKEVLENSSNDNEPIRTIHYDLICEIKREYKRVKFEKEDELSDFLRKIYKSTGIKFVVFIDEYDLIDLRGNRYENNTKDYLWLISKLMPEEDDEYLALVYVTGVLPVGFTTATACFKNFDEYTIYNPNILTEILKKNTHSCDVAQIKYLISNNRNLVREYIMPLICGVKVSTDLDILMREKTNEGAILAILSYMGVIRYENHALYLDDEIIRIYLLNSIYSETLHDYASIKSVFEEKYEVDEKLDRELLINDILIHNFNLAYKYKLPEITVEENRVVITYYPRDEYHNTEKIKRVYLVSADSMDNILEENKVAIVIHT